MTSAQQPPAQPPVQGPAAPEIDPPYQAKLERLSEIMGALHYLRGLCVPAEAQLWRQEMSQLLEAEAASANRRDRLVQAFNRGQAAFRETYRSCTPAAIVAGERYRGEGSQLAHDIASRFAD